MRTTRSLGALWMMLVASFLALTLLAPAPLLATPPGPVGRIAFDDFLTGQIYAVNPDGSGLAQLTNVDADHVAVYPSWSADGSHVLYSVLRTNSASDHARIWIVGADGTGARRVTGDVAGFRDYQPTITPDGRFIVFSRCKRVCAIWRMRSDGAHKRALTPYQEQPNEAVDFDPAVSSDGRKVAFTRFFSDGIIARIFVMGIDGSEPHAITARRDVACGADWAPSDYSLLFIGRCSGLSSQVFTADPDGEDVRRLTHDPYPTGVYDAVFSPAGTQIAFSDDRRYDDFCCSDLFVMDADGRHEHRVPTGDQMGVFRVSWGSAPLASGQAPASITHEARSIAAPRQSFGTWQKRWMLTGP